MTIKYLKVEAESTHWESCISNNLFTSSRGITLHSTSIHVNMSEPKLPFAIKLMSIRLKLNVKNIKAIFSGYNFQGVIKVAIDVDN